MSSDRINGTLESHQKYQIAPPTVIVLLIGCLSGTILILLIIIGVCLVRGSPGYGKAKKSKENTHSPHNNREGKLLFQCNIITLLVFDHENKMNSLIIFNTVLMCCYCSKNSECMIFKPPLNLSAQPIIIYLHMLINHLFAMLVDYQVNNTAFIVHN